MTPEIDTELFEFVNKIASDAASLTLDWFQQKDLKVDLKSDRTEVTDADKAVEEYLRNIIGTHFPNTLLLGKKKKSLPVHQRGNG